MFINTKQYSLNYDKIQNYELEDLLAEEFDETIQSILSSSQFKYDISPKSNNKMTVIIIRSDDRLDAKEKINGLLDQYRIKHQDGVVSSTSVDIRSTDAVYMGTKFRFMYKPLRAGGIGAGAEITALGECFQAYACAARQEKGKDLETAEEIFNMDAIRDVEADRTLEQCKKLSAHWLRSAVIIANQFVGKYGKGTKFIFHRGSKIVSDIESEFHRLAKKEGLKMNVNKWSPADIWAVSTKFRSGDLKNFDSLNEYNRFIMKEFRKNNLVGVSLKVVKGNKAKEEIYNDEGQPEPKIKLDAIGFFNKKFDFFSDRISKTVHLYYSVNGNKTQMNFRTFSGGTTNYAGEIIGKYAAGGKVGASALESILDKVGVPRGAYLDVRSFKSFVKGEPPDHIFKQYVNFYKDLNPREKRQTEVLIEKAREQFRAKGPGWFYSKFLGMQILSLVVKGRKVNEFLKEIVRYASSSTAHSAVFVKYS